MASSASFQHLVRRTAAPAAAYLLSLSAISRTSDMSLCEAPPPAQDTIKNEAPIPVVSNAKISTEHFETAAHNKPTVVVSSNPTETQSAVARKPTLSREGMQTNSSDDETLFHGLFPARQLFRPTVEWPLWNYNWDGRRLPPTGDADADKRRERTVRKTGVTRHIILIRHGQYDETHKEDEKRILTPLGREQADLTGRRLAEMIAGIDEEFGPCNVKVVRVSDMARAKETADLICKHLPDVERSDPDPMLNEGRPCHHIPGGKANATVVSRTDENHPRIEKAFKKYFFRADRPSEEEKVVSVKEADAATQAKEEAPLKGVEVPQPQDGEDANKVKEEEKPAELKLHPKHEFEIIVCHANVIRYFTCRALQIPPEAWLRLCTFNCSLTYLTIRPTGSVSCRMLGDIGHLGLAKSTFSGHHGFNW